MKEYIDRELAIKQLEFGVTRCALATDADEYEEQYMLGFIAARQDDIHSIKILPTADVAPVVHGEWVIPVTKEPWREGFVGMCTNCGYTNSHTKKAPKFCEDCGACMDGGNK